MARRGGCRYARDSRAADHHRLSPDRGQGAGPHQNRSRGGRAAHGGDAGPTTPDTSAPATDETTPLPRHPRRIGRPWRLIRLRCADGRPERVLVVLAPLPAVMVESHLGRIADQFRGRRYPADLSGTWSRMKSSGCLRILDGGRREKAVVFRDVRRSPTRTRCPACAVLFRWPAGRIVAVGSRPGVPVGRVWGPFSHRLGRGGADTARETQPKRDRYTP